MATVPFDPVHAVRFELGAGRVSAAGGERLVLVPASAIEELAKGEAGARAIGAAVGRAVGGRVAAQLSPSGAHDAARAATIDAFVTQLAGELAVLGYGVASVERWGRAMVIVVEHPVGTSALASAIVEAALEAATGRAVRCTALTTDAHSLRLLVSSARTAERVKAWLDDGVAWGEALTKLQTKGASS